MVVRRLAQLFLFLVLPVTAYLWAQGVRTEAPTAAFVWHDLSITNPDTLPTCNADNEGEVYQHPDNGHIYLCVGHRSKGRRQ